MDKFGEHLRSDAKRSWPALVVSAVVDLIKMLLEHRILGAINEYIDAHSGPILNAVRPFLIWFVHTPFVLLTLTACGILIHTYIRSQRDMNEPELPTEPPTPPAPTTTV